VATASATLILWLFALLTTRQVDNLGTDFGGDRLQLCPADAGLEHF
jgi:hypothetical protein